MIVLPAAALADPPVDQVPPTISAPDGPYVGESLGCDTGTWDRSDYNFTYEFLSGSTVVQSFSASSTYALQGTDTGNSMTCVVQADNGVDSPVQETSSNAMTAGGPPPSFTVTMHSAVVSGNEGITPSGATTVALTLQRPDSSGSLITVASGSANVSAIDGAWTATLVPAGGRTQALAVSQDALAVHYSGPGAPADQVMSSGSSLPFVDSDVQLASDGSKAIFSDDFGSGDCSNARFMVDASPVPTSSNGFTCQASFSPAITDGNHVQISDQVGLNEIGGSGGGNVVVVADVGLLPASGVNSVSPPSCSGDLVDGTVSCTGLNGRSFAVTRGSDTLALNPSNGQGSASLPGGLHAGDIVQLREQGSSRVLTSFTADPLREDIVDGAISGGSCEPYKWLGQADALCPASGSLAGIAAADESSLDDTSGGSTTLDIPSFDFTSPTDGDAMTSSFTAYADTIGPAPTSMTLTVFHRNGDGSNGAHAAGPVTVDPSAGALVSGLTNGRYNGVWKLIDAHGDTSTIHTQFVVQSGGGQGPGGAQGPQGPTGATGPQGPAGASGIGIKGVTCQLKAKTVRRHKKKITQQYVVCAVTTTKAVDAKLTMALVHGKVVYATGTLKARGRKFIVQLHITRPLHRTALSLVIAYDKHGNEHKGSHRVVVP